MENILETKVRKMQKLILINLFSYKFEDFTEEDKNIFKDIKLLISLREYLGIKKDWENQKNWFNKIKYSLEEDLKNGD